MRYILAALLALMVFGGGSNTWDGVKEDSHNAAQWTKEKVHNGAEWVGEKTE